MPKKNKKKSSRKMKLKSSLKKKVKLPSIKKKKKKSIRSAAPVAVSRKMSTPAPLVGGKSGFRIKHRELLQDVVGSIAYNGGLETNVYEINPGLTSSFPWLGPIAQNFEQYKFNSLRWEFVPRCATTTPGSFYMATSYDARENPPFTSDAALSAYRNSVSDNVWRGLTHNSAIEAGKFSSKNMIRNSLTLPSNTDIREYDVGTFTFATEGCADNTTQLGQLWVMYDLFLYNPKLPQFGGAYTSVQTTDSVPVTSANFLSPIDENNVIGQLPPKQPGAKDPNGNLVEDFFTLDPTGKKIRFQRPGIYEVTVEADTNVQGTSLSPGFATITTTDVAALDTFSVIAGTLNTGTGYIGLAMRFLVQALTQASALGIALTSTYNVYRRLSMRSFDGGFQQPPALFAPLRDAKFVTYSREARDALARMVRQGQMREENYREIMDYVRSSKHQYALLGQEVPEEKKIPFPLGIRIDRRESVTSEGDEEPVVVPPVRKLVEPAEKPERRSKSKEPPRT